MFVRLFWKRETTRQRAARNCMLATTVQVHMRAVQPTTHHIRTRAVENMTTVMSCVNMIIPHSFFHPECTGFLHLTFVHLPVHAHSSSFFHIKYPPSLRLCHCTPLHITPNPRNISFPNHVLLSVDYTMLPGIYFPLSLPTINLLIGFVLCCAHLTNFLNLTLSAPITMGFSFGWQTWCPFWVDIVFENISIA